VEDLTPRLRAWAAALSREEFVARAAGYYLVIGALPNEEDPFAFDTRNTHLGRMLSGDVLANASLIVALRKSERSPYSTLISVGRARNCDVVLRASTVSKLHAQFIVEEAGWKLVDRESANKTLVNGRVIEPERPIPIAPGDRLKFGAIDCLLADAEVLIKALKRS